MEFIALIKNKGTIDSLMAMRKEHDFRILTWKKRQNSLKAIKSEKYQRISNQYPISKKEIEEIDNFFISNYGEKIPYDCHRYYAAHSGVLTPLYFPDFLYFPYFECFMNINSSYAEVFEDKNIIPYVAKIAGVLMPTTIVSGTKGIYRNSDNILISRDKVLDILNSKDKVFCKPATVYSGGHGCFIADLKNKETNTDIVLSKLGKDFVIQELVNCDQSIKTLYPLSVNTFRVSTYRWKDEIYTMPVAMRLGQNGSVVDNASSGGMFIGVNNDGTLTDRAVTVDNRKFTEHPDTHFVFSRHKINNFNMVIEAAKKMHAMLPQLGVVGWDFTVNDEGKPMLIEANIRNASYRLGQMTLGLPAFGDRTAEVLQWIHKMKHTSFTKLKDFAYGNI